MIQFENVSNTLIDVFVGAESFGTIDLDPFRDDEPLFKGMFTSADLRKMAQLTSTDLREIADKMDAAYKKYLDNYDVDDSQLPDHEDIAARNQRPEKPR